MDKQLSGKARFWIAAALVAVGVLGRLLPHAWNFAPIVAIGLFAGARLGKGYGFAVPVLAMAVSDAFIGFYQWDINVSVYLAMALSGGIGYLARRGGPLHIAGGSLLSSTVFFLVTNAAVWKFAEGMYEPGLGGLFASYAAGIPFFKNALFGDLWYTLAFFGIYELVWAIYRNLYAQKKEAVEAEKAAAATR